MRVLLQRVTSARVVVGNNTIGEIDQGLLVFLAVEKEDTEEKAERLVQRILNYRIFSDEDDKMNLNVQQMGGGVLVVSQFTLAADTAKGNRPSFTPAADPRLGESLYTYFVKEMSQKYHNVETGAFGADMKVHLVNDGPVTIWLEL